MQTGPCMFYRSQTLLLLHVVQERSGAGGRGEEREGGGGRGGGLHFLCYENTARHPGPLKMVWGGRTACLSVLGLFNFSPFGL